MKKQSNTVLLFIIGLSVIFSSCVGGGLIDDPYEVSHARQRENFYTTPPSSLPVLLNKNNDLAFSWQRGINKLAVAHDFSGAMLVSDHIGVMAKYQMIHDETSLERMNGNRWEGAVGYAKPLKQSLLFEVYGGGGFGKITNYHHTGSSTLNTNLFFIQPGLGLVTKDGKFKMGIATRVGGENLEIGMMGFNEDREKLNAQEFRNIVEEPLRFFVEPSFVAQGGWKAVHISAGGTIRNDFSDRKLHGPNSRFFVGLSVQINTKETNNLPQKNNH